MSGKSASSGHDQTDGGDLKDLYSNLKKEESDSAIAKKTTTSDLK
jgi:hypothetical protein